MIVVCSSQQQDYEEGDKRTSQLQNPRVRSLGRRMHFGAPGKETTTHRHYFRTSDAATCHGSVAKNAHLMRSRPREQRTIEWGEMQELAPWLSH
jgi:hypothetical protein